MSTKTPASADVRRAAVFAYSAGATGILANLLLIGFYALQASHPEDGIWLGTANDLVGSLGSAFMIPVAVALGERLPERRAVRVTQAAGVAALVVLTVGGPLLVLGVLAFEVQMPIMLAAFTVFAGWLFLVNRWLRRSGGDLRSQVARLGERLGAATLVSAAIVGLGLLLPSQWPRLVVSGVGGLLVAVAILGIPVWFLLLGRHLARESSSTSSPPTVATPNRPRWTDA